MVYQSFSKVEVPTIVKAIDYHAKSHGDDNKKAYKHFEGHVKAEMSRVEANAKKRSDMHDLAVAGANIEGDYDWDSADSLKQYGDNVKDKFEAQAKRYHGKEDGDSLSEDEFRALFGMSQSELYDVAVNEGRNAPDKIKEKLTEKLNRDRGEQYQIIGNKYILDKVTAGHMAELTGATKLESYDKKGTTPDAMKALFSRYWQQGKVVTDRDLGAGSRSSALEDLVVAEAANNNKHHKKAA